MKFYELIKVLSYDQDEITLIFPTNVKRKYKRISDIPISYANYKVIKVYGYDASGYDGLLISLVEE